MRRASTRQVDNSLPKVRSKSWLMCGATTLYTRKVGEERFDALLGRVDVWVIGPSSRGRTPSQLVGST